MDVTGSIVEIFDTVQITDTFKKREFVIEYVENPQYPELIKFELIQDKCGLLDRYQTGQQIKVEFNLRGRKWTDRQGQVKYFNTLQAWRLSDVAAGAGETGAPPAFAPPFQDDTTDYANEQIDDVPF